MRRPSLRSPVVLAVVLLALPVASGLSGCARRAGPAAGDKPEQAAEQPREAGVSGGTEQAQVAHPEVDPGADCAECHQEITPEVVNEWNGSQHGLQLVRCFVCHGSTGSDFTTAPSSEKCIGCHSAAVGSVTTPSGEISDCFTCHDPHGLAANTAQNPHQEGEGE